MEVNQEELINIPIGSSWTRAGVIKTESTRNLNNYKKKLK